MKNIYLSNNKLAEFQNTHKKGICIRTEYTNPVLQGQTQIQFENMLIIFPSKCI